MYTKNDLAYDTDILMDPHSTSPVWEDTDHAWLTPNEEGRLLVDIFRDDDHLIVRSPVAGLKLEQLEVSLHEDLLTIRGTRSVREDISEDDWFYRECHWGAFSRSIILPTDVLPERAEASLHNGVLEIRIPIRYGERRITVRTIEEP